MDRSNRVPRATPGVTASPVDTAVFAGQEGAPAQPNPLAKPQFQPNMFDAEEAMRMQRALGQLSESLGGATFAIARNEQIIGGQYEEYGEQMGAIAAYMNSEGRVFTEALSQEQIEALDHPRAQLGMARGSAGVAARGMYKDLEANLAGMRVGDHAKDIGHYAAAFDEALNKMAYDYSGPRPDLFRQELLTASLPLRDRWVSENRAWINTQLIKDSESNLVAATNDIMEATFGSRRDVTVESSLHDPNSLNPNEAILGRMGLAKTQRIVGVSDKEHFNRRVEDAAASLTKMIDSEQGGLISSSNLNEIVAMQLIDLAKSSSELSAFAEAVLLKTETGPEDSRASILTGRAKDEYLKSKDTIKSRQVTANKASANKQFKEMMEQQKTHLVNTMIGQMEKDPSIVGTALSRNIQSVLLGDRQSTTLENGIRVKLHGSDTLIFTPPEGGVADAEVHLNLSKMAETAKTMTHARATERAMRANPAVSRLQAEAIATAETGISSPQVKDTLQRVINVTNQYRMMSQNDSNFNPINDEQFEGIRQAARESYTAFLTLREAGRLDTLSQDQVEFFDLFDLLMTDPNLSQFGGNVDKTLDQLSRVNTAASNSWDNEAAKARIGSHPFSQDPGTNNFAMNYVERLAKGLLNVGAVHRTEEAVEIAIDSWSKKTVEMSNGIRVLEEDVKLKTERPVVREYNEGDWELLYFDGVRGPVETAEQFIKAAPELAGILWDTLMSRLPGGGDVDVDPTEFGRRLKDTVVGIQTNLHPRFEELSDSQIMDGALEVLKTAPPRWFADSITVGEYKFEEYYWIPVHGSQGNFFRLMGRTSIGSTVPILNDKNKETKGYSQMWSILDITTLFAEGNGFELVDGEYLEDTSPKPKTPHWADDLGPGPMGSLGY